MDRCPSCRARINGADHCRRCGMTLDLLNKVEEAAEAQLARALSHLANGDSDAASAALRRLLSLQQDQFAEQLLAFAERPTEHESGGAQQDTENSANGALPNGFYMSD